MRTGRGAVNSVDLGAFAHTHARLVVGDASTSTGDRRR
jgi:hypothetical protein